MLIVLGRMRLGGGVLLGALVLKEPFLGARCQTCFEHKTALGRSRCERRKKKRCVCPWVFEDHLFHPFSGDQGVFLLGVHGFNGELVLKLVFSQNLSVLASRFLPGFTPLGGDLPTFRNTHDGSMGRKVIFAYVKTIKINDLGKSTINGSYGILKQGEFQCFPGVYILHCWTYFR